MNNWLKIGLPVLIAVLLVVATVGVTLATTGSGNFKQIVPVYRTGDTATVQYAYGPRYGGCPAWQSSNYNGGQGWCWYYTD